MGIASRAWMPARSRESRPLARKSDGHREIGLSGARGEGASGAAGEPV